MIAYLLWISHGILKGLNFTGLFSLVVRLLQMDKTNDWNSVEMFYSLTVFNLDSCIFSSTAIYFISVKLMKRKSISNNNFQLFFPFPNQLYINSGSMWLNSKISILFLLNIFFYLYFFFPQDNNQQTELMKRPTFSLDIQKNVRKMKEILENS